MIRISPLLVVIFGSTQFACDASVGAPDGGLIDRLDSGAVLPPPTPVLSPGPERIPYTIATLRGAAEGKRVIVEGAGNPMAAPLLPDQTFCIDVPLSQPGSYALNVYAQGIDGQISEMPAMFGVEFDPQASAIPGATTCSGSDPAGCPGAVEICDNQRDDDCNNLVDEQDPACTNCVDDALEPNDDITAPRVSPDRYDGLQICSGNQDVFGVFLRDGEVLNARLFFSHADGNLDLELVSATQEFIDRSVSFTDDESLTYTATATGDVKLVVFAEPGVENQYTLDVQVE